MNESNVKEDVMDVYFLGAGKPASGNRPSALKEVGASTCALDWQLHSLESIRGANIHFVGGYHVEKVVERYPQLHYTVVADWKSESILHTLFEAPLRKTSTLVTYADTIFRNDAIAQVAQSTADVVLLYDSQWEQRYGAREKEDLLSAEVISLVDGRYSQRRAHKKGEGVNVEFTGMIKFAPHVAEYISTLKEHEVGSSLLDLIDFLCERNYQIDAIDVKGNWAEFNSPCDIAHFILGTKAETLSRLAPLVKTCQIGKQVSFTTSEWLTSKSEILSRTKELFDKKALIVRSSAGGEDSWDFSNAGGFESILNVDGTSSASIATAVESVIASYGETFEGGKDQVLIQEFIRDINFAGVVFTCNLETGAPYYLINYDDKTASTESVTAGTHGDLRTVLINSGHYHYLPSVEPKLIPVLNAVKELEGLLGFEKLDIEFAVDLSGVVHIFQVRPITVDHSDYEIEKGVFDSSIQDAVIHFHRLQAKTPFILGSRTFFGNMPDWNPAEIIGTRPKPLAFSLYRSLITDEIWARQRAEFGYQDVRPHPLIVSFCGQPYVDIRASLNSFIPAQLSNQTAEKIIESYLCILQDQPMLHDKLEFDVAFTVWTPSFESEATKRLMPYGVTKEQIDEMAHALKGITKAAVLRLERDIHPIQTLIERRGLIENSSLAPLDKALALLEDCKRFGTLAFSHAARAGFVAMSFLKSFVSQGILSDADRQAFLKTIKTVASEFEEDGKAVTCGQLSREAYLKHYGHLRPGTYDIAAKAYWEDPQRYLFSREGASACVEEECQFQFTTAAREAIEDEIFKIDTGLSFESFIQYIINAIQAREYVKFEFTRNLSRALDALSKHALDLGYSREDITYLTINEFEQLKVGPLLGKDLSLLIEQRKRNYSITQMIELPQILFQESDFYCFERHASLPNFVTGKRVEADVVTWTEGEFPNLEGKIVLIPQADPGFDWLFNYKIAGLLTKYGGANSHMAIRTAEMGLPAAIGIGDKLYDYLAGAQRIQLDCANKQIRRI